MGPGHRPPPCEAAGPGQGPVGQATGLSAAVPELESVPAPALIDLDAEHLVTIQGMVSNLLNA